MIRFRLKLLAPAALLTLALAFLSGCGHKDISVIDRKTAANQMSEAQFAVTLKDLPRAEGLSLQATKLCPDNGDYWLFLGTVQARLNKKSDAKSAYDEALDAYKAAYKAAPTNDQLFVQQLYVLMLMGRGDDAKSMLQKAVDANPSNYNLKNFSNSKAIDRMLADPGLKDLSI